MYSDSRALKALVEATPVCVGSVGLADASLDAGIFFLSCNGRRFSEGGTEMDSAGMVSRDELISLMFILLLPAEFV
jgi:hypothetical protein